VDGNSGCSPDSVAAARALLADAVGERYALEGPLARGGMATVYLARDLRDGLMVAIKVMHPDVATAIGTERFLREVAIAREMAHPLIVPVKDSGNASGALYYIMPYVDGDSLHQRLERERQLPLELALQITHDVGSALGYAHGHGVLHRDVKPENILLTEGRALIADFGLARAIGPADYQRLTQTGVIVGTVHYMSPEQLLEDQDLDQRADIYGLGCVLYEALTGEPPYSGVSLTDLVTRILRSPVPSARRLEPGVPEEVDEAIGRALAKSAADRFPTMQEFTAALPRPAC
jgi:serine/threonine protein kinase